MSDRSIWTKHLLGEVAQESATRASVVNATRRPVYGVDRHLGLTSEAKYQSSSLDRYKIIDHDMFAYNPMRLNIGSIAYCSTRHAPGLVSPDYVVFSCRREMIVPQYLYYYIKGPEWKRWTNVAGVGSVRTRIYFKELARMPMRIPPLPEQQSVAQILGSLDDRIELNRRMNATLEAMARAIFKSWFVDFDPVRTKMEGLQPGETDAEIAALFPDSFEDSGLGPVPSGWIATTLGQLCRDYGGEIRTGPFGTALHADEYSSEGTPVVAVRDIQNGYVMTSKTTPRVKLEIAERLSAYRLKRGDILFGRKGAVERSAYITQYEESWIMGSDCIRLRLPPTLHPIIWACSFRTPSHVAWIQQHATGTTMASLNQHIIERIPVIVPPMNIREVFAQFLQSLEEKVSLNRQDTITLSKLHAALLPRLLSGQICARDAEKTVEAHV